jgi:hypothetical protein
MRYGQPASSRAPHPRTRDSCSCSDVSPASGMGVGVQSSRMPPPETRNRARTDAHCDSTTSPQTWRISRHLGRSVLAGVCQGSDMERVLKSVDTSCAPPTQYLGAWYRGWASMLKRTACGVRTRTEVFATFDSETDYFGSRCRANHDQDAEIRRGRRTQAPSPAVLSPGIFRLRLGTEPAS